MSLWQQDAAALAQTFAVGDASAVEITTAHLDRIDAVNPEVNAVIRRIDDRALEQAAKVDAARAAGSPLGPLAGVPFTIKDNIDLADDVTTRGVPELEDFVPSRSAPVVERMIEAGAIPLARTNLPDLGLRLHTHSSLHGLTPNPWDPARTAGGSSGGDAAALATGMTPLGLGNDLGGSLRNPATCCSIASLKPTFGRVPHAEEGPLSEESIVSQVLAVEGPMARRVTDVRLQLQVIAGAHPRDPWSVPATFGERPAPVRIALLGDPPGGSTDPRIVAATERAGSWLADAGHLVETVAPQVFEPTLACWKALVMGDATAALDDLRTLVSPDVFSFLEGAVVSAGHPSSDDISAGWTQRHQLIAAWNEQVFRQFDVLVTPTWTQLPFEHGADIGLDGAAATLEMARSVLPANVMGFPSAAVPATMIDGLPVGLLVTGPAWSDLTCLTVAADIEARNEVPDTPIDPIRAQNTA